MSFATLQPTVWRRYNVQPSLSVRAGWQQGFCNDLGLATSLLARAASPASCFLDARPKEAVTERDAEKFWSLGAYSPLAVQYSEVLRV